MKIIYFGNNRRGISILEYLFNQGINISAVVSDPDFDDRNDWFMSITKTSNLLGYKTLSFRSINSEEFQEIISTDEPDLFILCGYSKILGKKLLNIPKLGAINLHAGKIPAYRGAAPLNWAIIRGETEIGISILKVDEGIDTGELIDQTTFNITIDDTINDVAEKVTELYKPLLTKCLIKIAKENAIQGKKQDLAKGFFCTKRFEEDGKISWAHMNMIEIHNLIRAITRPYPPAFCSYKGKKILIVNSRIPKSSYFGIPGRIAKRNKIDGSVIIICKDKGIEILRCEVDGIQCSPFQIFNDLKEKVL